jgi:hypothetical protein
MEPTEPHVLQFFAFGHLPPALRDVSRPFGELAKSLLDLPDNPQRELALTLLLQAKDAAVRALLAKDPR